MLRKVLPTGSLLAAVAVQQANNADDKPSKAVADQLPHYKCKMSDLPLYAPLHSHNPPRPVRHPPKDSAVYQNIEGGVRLVRQEVQSVYKVAAAQVDVVENYYETAKAHTQSTIDYLNEPQNIMPRSGAIAIGGLAGFIFATRGGFIKKVLYTTTGAGAIASMCYPKQAEHFARDALHEARKGYSIAYNFVKGVKPGDEVQPETISKFPTSLEDVKYMLYDLYDEAKEVVFPNKK